jgi:D-alanyl-D-alanine carboxypeptidase
MSRGTKVLAVGIFVALLSGCGGSESSSEPVPLPFGSEVQQVLVDRLAESNGAGVSAAVIVAGYEPWVGAAGYSAIGSDELVPMRSDMLFQIGSAGKNFAAALMLQLVEEGRFTLDDPIGRWFSGYDQIDPEITVRELLNHTGGINDWEDNPQSFTGIVVDEGYEAFDWADWWSMDDIMGLVGEPDFPRGESWHYSNTGYYLTRRIIETETGMPISQALRTRLLDPLDLDAMWVECDQPAPDDLDFAPIFWDINGDLDLDEISDQPEDFLCSVLSGPIWTTAEDLARWSQALFHEGRVLTDESLVEMLTFVPATTDPTEPMVLAYGLGVAKFRGVPELEGLDHYGHGGSGIGYDALMIYLPQHQATVVALFNENATIDVTAGPLLDVVDRNLRGGIPIVPLGVAIAVVAVLGFVGWRTWRNRHPSIIDN